MIIVSENLHGIVRSLKICDESLAEAFSIKLRLDRQVRRLLRPKDGLAPIPYETPFDQKSYFGVQEQISDNLIMSPQECVLACSQDVYNMPVGYFGLIQTKGSLARMFVSATANDGQVEPGYSGKITLELINHSPFSISLRPGAAVAQLFVLRCSSEVTTPYEGRYQGATGPTMPIFY